MKNIALLNLKVVKEAAVKYENLPEKISSPRDAYDVCKYALDMEDLAEENLYMMTLDTKNKVTGFFRVSQGSINSSIVHPREIFKRALLMNATSIIIAHNHPSGNKESSSEDINVTRRINEVGKMIGIDLLDHIIVGENCYTSLKEKGIL